MLGGEPEPTHEESFTVQEMQTEIESKFFGKTPEAPSKPETSLHTSPVDTSEPEKPPPKSEGPGKFQQAIKTQAGKFKSKLHGIKKPNIKLPATPKITKPNFDKFKFEKPKINLPTFSLPRKNPLKRSLKQRQLSTESNAGDSKKNYFDFRTYPRLFKKKQKDDFDSSFSSKSEREVPEFATVPRTKRSQEETDRWGGRDSIRVPLHKKDSVEDNDREDSVERRIAAHMRYEQDIDIDDAYERENQEIHTASPFSHDYNSRWNHGSFHPDPNLEFRDNTENRQVTDLDSPGDAPAPHESFDTNTSKDVHSSESSLGVHRRGVLEEIDSDEFFLRQKGISQDNIEVGMYLSSEIREAFKSPTNALADLQREPRDFSYEARASNQSLPETPSKRKVIKKPKRKKTPHVSQEQIVYDQDSEQELADLPPCRPKRRSKRNKKQKEPEAVVPYQETIAVNVLEENIGILGNSEYEPEKYQIMYENEQMQGKEQPEIKVIDPYADFKYDEKYDSDDEVFRDEISPPAAPPRKNRSLKSLNYSEHDSILGEFNTDKEPLSQDIEVYKTEHEYIIPTPEIPPTKPPRTLSRSSSKSRENEEINEETEEGPVKPTRTRSRSRTRSRADSLTMEEACVEEPCVQDFRDCMGYAVIDKHHVRREPPLPPPRTPPRRKRSVQSTKSKISEQKFFTVPRPLNDEPPPTRPLRNYSTLGPSRPPRRKPPVNMTDEEKENIDITQYIEIEDEPNRDLHSGEVIQKMRDRPLPAPPRPPRKTRALHDITSQENIVTDSQENIAADPYDTEKSELLEETKLTTDETEFTIEEYKTVTEETEVSTQTEPLLDHTVCEEELQEDDTITSPKPETSEHIDVVTVETHLITPTHYTYNEETITHGSLVVEPLNGAKILPDSEITQREAPIERSILVSKDYEDETSEIPEEFTKLRDPTPIRTSSTPQPSVIERIIERPVLVQPDSNTEVEILKAQKLQVSDLDVDRLSVNELLASKIIVSEIDSGSIQANEISSKSGALKVGEIELPPGVVQQLFEKLQTVAQEQQSSGPIVDPKPVTETSAKKDENEDAGQKKTPFENVTVETLPQRPPRKAEEIQESSAPQIEDSIEEIKTVDVVHTQTDSLNEIEEQDEIQETTEPPKPPTRSDSSIRPAEPQPVSDTPQEVSEESEQAPQRPPRHAEKLKIEEAEVTEEPQRMEEPEIDDEPPPRPPEPQIHYVPSQPPPSFYALRAQQYIDSFEGDIPMAPRRRRHHKPPISRSSSDESPAPPPSRRRYRSPEPTIPHLTGQLIQACGSAANNSIKRLIAHITNNMLSNADGQQDMHVIMVILLVLIAGLILLGYGDGKTVHYHHWEYFNPPRDM
ncbi:hypothetical protein BDFB_010194 [Asbolus verrucosus]|uniref:Titin n=1 Tax=Asbolus verrucosus TaxID=1661398 RepID=A0A482W8U0_ASBVE|nr:hypothetical protein BDFB_010194 [Asbolus verrucosus]